MPTGELGRFIGFSAVGSAIPLAAVAYSVATVAPLLSSGKPIIAV